MNNLNYMKDRIKFEECVKNSYSTTEALLKLGYNSPSNFYTSFKRYIIKYNIDISHFLSFKEIISKRKLNWNKYSLSEILIENFNGNLSGTVIKQKLYKNKLKQPICELCNQDENWKTGKISMILDHINGDNRDNRIENLRIVCPNCDATLSTYKGKNKKRIQKSNEEKIKYIAG